MLFNSARKLVPRYPGHVPTNLLQQALLAAGSGLGSFLDPTRQDFIAVVGETTVSPYFVGRLRDVMLSDETGRRILRDRPRMTSTSLDVEALAVSRPNSVGRVYAEWLAREGVSPDTRLPVRYINDPECAYVFQRYRECHDFYHALTGLPIVREGEIALKMFEFANLVIPMAGIGAILAPLRISADQRRRLRTIYFPWAVRNGLSCKSLINIYWEEIMDRDMDDLRAELGIETPPDLRDLRKREKKEKKEKA
ncbi:ubiquinone biosynthesis protein Coq4 [Dipodascopsis tothii]|uniref:ubiquinone biosynthesis protein Coq4 n=1 Tax=Dipodascopsis tothii TaxID=44089 RepID=UPI0034CDD500